MIFDTGILIDILDGNESVRKRLEQFDEKISTTVISKYELLKAPKEDKARDLLNALDVYSFDGTAPGAAAKIFKHLKGNGKMINELDILIASIAIAHDELLITKDNDFKRIEHLKVLVL